MIGPPVLRLVVTAPAVGLVVVSADTTVQLVVIEFAPRPTAGTAGDDGFLAVSDDEPKEHRVERHAVSRVARVPALAVVTSAEEAMD